MWGWQDFQQGIEHVVFIKVQEGTSQAGASRMLEAFNNLLDQLESSILVQVTAGEENLLHSRGYEYCLICTPYLTSMESKIPGFSMSVS